jgi:hypothetical protein
MACGCNKKASTTKPKWIVSNPDGTKTTVDSLTAAMSAARQSGGTYQRA